MGMHSSDLSIITPYAVKTFLNVRYTPRRHILWNPAAWPGARGPHCGQAPSPRRPQSPCLQGGGFGVDGLALTVQVSELGPPRRCAVRPHVFAVCSSRAAQMPVCLIMSLLSQKCPQGFPFAWRMKLQPFTGHWRPCLARSPNPLSVSSLLSAWRRAHAVAGAQTEMCFVFLLRSLWAQGDFKLFPDGQRREPGQEDTVMRRDKEDVSGCGHSRPARPAGKRVA